VRDHSAIEKLYQVKGRSKDKSIPILVANSDQLVGIISPPGKIVQEIMAVFWPGALTLVLPLLPGLPENLSNTNTIGVRIPDHEFTRKLLLHTGPLAATSANLSGKESSETALEVEKAFGDEIDLILDGGHSPGGMASTVLDCTSTELAIIRAGPISLDKIREKIS
jgi:tRNA threonylcarbamoyl adenosine modification protein (Sua5/YciO/YrdC/YwlC family)